MNMHSPALSSQAAAKARQSAKIREIAEALVSAGLARLDEQAGALGLCRSTAWTILKANHKSTGISPTIIKRMLATRMLPAAVRVKILEYTEEKAAGLYGHSKTQRRRFIGLLTTKLAQRHAEIAPRVSQKHGATALRPPLPGQLTRRIFSSR